MAHIKDPSPVVLLLAVISRHESARVWARQRAVEQWGPVELSSDAFAFEETDYYTPSMGADLKKQFLAFEQLINPAELARIKRQTNDWESAYSELARHPEPRPLNLDPGYVTEAKLVLASTKDHSHRLYLSHGIYAEVTLHYRDHRWQHREWTYPDYRREDYQQFFICCRDTLRRRRGGTA